MGSSTIDFWKNRIVKFKLEHFCWIAPVHYGTLVLGYFNLLLSILSLLATTNDTYSPLFKRVQELILDLEANTVTACTLAYATEEALAVVVIIGMHRRDLVLLRVCLYAELTLTALTLLLYIAVALKIDALLTMTFFIIIAYDCYFILMLRSSIVIFREQQKQDEQKIKDLELGEKLQEKEPEVKKDTQETRTLDAVSETDEESSEGH